MDSSHYDSLYGSRTAKRSPLKARCETSNQTDVSKMLRYHENTVFSKSEIDESTALHKKKINTMHENDSERLYFHGSLVAQAKTCPIVAFKGSFLFGWGRSCPCSPFFACHW